MVKSNKNGRGLDLSDLTAHQQDHKNWSRRSFLQTIGMAGGLGLGLGGFGLTALGSVPLALATATSTNDRILVLIRLKGGNDGLNTIIPVFDYSRYKNNRPTIAIPQTDLIGLGNNNKFAIPKSMSKIKPLWDEGKMKIINSVGYPDHNLSHFTSSDIWNSANQNIESDMDKSGWLGRFLLDRNPDYLENLPEVPGAIKVSSGSSITYHTADRIDLAVNFNTPDKLIEVAEKGFVYDTANLPDECYYGEQVGYLRSILNITYKYAPAISQAYSGAVNSVAYSNNELSRQLAIVARLIKGNLGTKLYMVTLDGFDTHENQNVNHPRLLNDVSAAISEFYADLAIGQKDNDVLSMTFSEFGRRPKENDGGTDHGAAAPVMFFGPALDGNAVFGKDPDLGELDPVGNLKHDTDFRSIYATLLESWLCIEASAVDNILGDTYERIPQLGFDCTGVNSTQNVLSQSIKHKVVSNSDGSYTVAYELLRPGKVIVEVYTILGQKISTLTDEYKTSGHHEALFINRQLGLSGAVYLYVIRSGQSKVSGKFFVKS
ncbi:MAG: DUF1501 domain-containing protein [Saprospiraceae bacterium]|nr:DUF1501 domain-containing protein [Saprospiraceae bacterium]MBK8853941.1 DUF1501 domain-containing protein [Saprospiraceae bacterium]